MRIHEMTYNARPDPRDQPLNEEPLPIDWEAIGYSLAKEIKELIPSSNSEKGENHMKAYYIPEEIYIMHIKFKIEQTNTIYVSSSSTTDCTIRLQGDLPEDRKQQALIKEVLAIILQLTGQADTSHDRGIEATASALYGVLMENDIRQRPQE